MKKKIIYCLIASFVTLSCLPANAGYYKTVYIEETQPNVVINNIHPKETVIVEKNNYTSSYNPAMTALGLTALVGGVILGVSAHNHHKKHHKYSHAKRKDPPHKGKHHPFRK